MPSKKLYVIAGEASGDLHGSNLMIALNEEDKNIEFRFWGGDKMAEIQPTGLVKHIKKLAFMGFIEVVMNLRKILSNIKFCKDDILNYQPDALILIDYPGFNLRIAEWAKSRGIKVYYYISPQVWAWKESRVKKIKKVVDHMFVILPFEKDFYANYNFEVEYVGHPLLDEISKLNHINDNFRKDNKLDDRPIIALLPGSRKQEVARKLPIMINAVKDLKTHQVIIAGAPTLSKSYYKSIAPSAKLIKGKTYEILAHADLAVVTSGTATLETALFKVPEVVCYKGSNISYMIAKQLVKVKYISLVNLIMDKEVVKELIQNECTSQNIRKEIDVLIKDQERLNQLKKSYDQLEEILGGGGASKKVAQSLLKTIE